MAMVQLYGDSLPNYNAVCRPLQDLGFKIIPQLGLDWGGGDTDYSNVADIWILVAYVSFFLIVLFLIHNPLLVTRRFFWVMTGNFVLRTLVVGVTRYPRLPFALGNYHPTNFLWGAILVVAGARTTATDIMFSGHTLGFITCASFVSRYMKHSLFSVFYWLFCAIGILSLLAVREHYTADVIVSLFIARLMFSNYHLFLDSEYIRFWKPGLELITIEAPAKITLPATIKDGVGNTFRIEPQGWHNHLLNTVEHVIHDDNNPTLIVPNILIQDALVQDAKKGTQYYVPVVQTNRYIGSGARFKIYSFFKWLDGE